ncbi:MAG: hypothetical protein M1820_010750 [Bogoriella megaspora]|nr:MAG: hypothetical protein M1820_010750 [Bogoriella megaspora]
MALAVRCGSNWLTLIYCLDAHGARGRELWSHCQRLLEGMNRHAAADTSAGMEHLPPNTRRLVEDVRRIICTSIQTRVLYAGSILSEISSDPDAMWQEEQADARVVETIIMIASLIALRAATLAEIVNIRLPRDEAASAVVRFHGRLMECGTALGIVMMS